MGREVLASKGGSTVSICIASEEAGISAPVDFASEEATASAGADTASEEASAPAKADAASKEADAPHKVGAVCGAEGFSGITGATSEEVEAPETDGTAEEEESLDLEQEDFDGGSLIESLLRVLFTPGAIRVLLGLAFLT